VTAVVAIASRRARPPLALVAAVGMAWLALAVAARTGRSHLLQHGMLADGDRPPWAALAAFAPAWQLTVVAMMLPSALPMIGLQATAASAHDRPRAARAAFVAGYLTVWGTFGLVALAGDMTLHRLVDASAWLSARPWLVAGPLLVAAGAAQFLPLTRACLRSCRHPYAYLLARFRPGTGAAFRLGCDHGLYCLGCCWALMLVMFAAGTADLAWMAVLSTVMVYEKVGRRGERVAAAVGLCLVAWGVLVSLHPSWVPGGLAGASLT
jgi:predicted metal-binding membrane protein